MSSVKFGTLEGGIVVFARNAELLRAGRAGVPEPCGAASTRGIWGGAEGGEAQECTPVCALAQGAAHLGGAAKTCQGCSQGERLALLALYFLLHSFPFHSALTLQLAHGAEVLQVSDVLTLAAIFIS